MILTIFSLSYFVYETIENEKSTKLTNWIHCDPWKWVGLHYLNLPEQCRGGYFLFINIFRQIISHLIMVLILIF